MIDELSTWKNSFKGLENVFDPEWADNVAAWYTDRISGIEIDNFTMPGPFNFPFNTNLLSDMLSSAGVQNDALANLTIIANAFADSMAVVPIAVLLGSYFGEPSQPANTFSSVVAAAFTPASILVAKQTIMQLAAATNNTESEYPIKIRQATKALKVQVVGLDSTPTPAGPLPLTIESPII